MLTLLAAGWLCAAPVVNVSVQDEPKACAAGRLLAESLRARGVETGGEGEPVRLSQVEGKWLLDWRGRKRALGEVRCEEAVSLAAAIVEQSLRSAEWSNAPSPVPPVGRTRPTAQLAPAPAQPAPAPAQLAPAPAQPAPAPAQPAPAPAQPASAPAQPAPAPAQLAPAPAQLAPAPAQLAPAPTQPAPAPDQPAPAPAQPAPAPPAPVVATQQPVSRLGGWAALTAGGWASTEPSLTAGFSARGGVSWSRWRFGLRAELALPRTQDVLINDTARGTLRRVDFSLSALAGHCFGDVFRLCPSAALGARFLHASSDGQLYQRRTALLTVPVLGADLLASWRFASRFELVAHLTPSVPLGRASAGIEGTTALAQVPAVELLFGVGLQWSSQ